jgi:nitrite reductase/ring-hydroxylating ferredoxin subunit
VIRRPDGKLYALSAVCTHAGCDLEYSGDALTCPCHNSTFDIRTGAPERGPARRPLETAQVVESGGRIVARPLRSG